MLIVVGTYEELVLGYKLNRNDETASFETFFTDHSHTASVRCVAVNSNGITATGSADESIKLFDTEKGVEIGSLLHHQGAVTGLKFFDTSHLFSHSDDGTIAIWGVDTWECLRTLKGHKGPVYSFAVHPSGKLALSCGKDKTLRTWNLINGRAAFVINLKQVADILLWSSAGTYYLTVAGNIVDIYSAVTTEVVKTLTVENKVSSAICLTDSLLALGCERGFVYIYNIVTGKKVCTINSETVRVKAITALDGDVKGTFRLIIASSDGFIKVYQVDPEQSANATLIAETSTGFRLLSVAARSPVSGGQSVVVSEKKTKKANNKQLPPPTAADSDSSESESDSDEYEAVQPKSKPKIEKQKQNLKRKRKAKKVKPEGSSKKKQKSGGNSFKKRKLV